MSERKKYTAQLRVDAVELVIHSGRSIVDCAEDLGINEGTLGNRVRMWRTGYPGDIGDERGPGEWAAFQVLAAENAELKRQDKFLGKVSAFFAAMYR